MYDFAEIEMKKESKKSFWKPVLCILIILVAILLLVAIIGDTSILIFDYTTLKNAELTFMQILKLDFPEGLMNPIGPFGVFFGHWFIYLLGKFFSISLLLGAILLGFFSVFLKEEKHFIWKTISFILFAFFFNFLLFAIRKETVIAAGIIPWYVYDFFIRIFGLTGTVIISSVIVIACLLIIFEVENAKKFMLLFLKGLWNFIKFIFSLFKSNKTKKVRKPKETRKPEKEKKEKTPTIIDHAALDENSNHEEDYKPPIIRKRKLSQDIAEKPEESLREYIKPKTEDFLISVQSDKRDREEIEENIKKVSKILVQKLAEFNVDAEVINVNIGPIITQYEIKPAPGVKVSKFHALADDLALAIKAKSIRVQAPIPGRGLIGIEIPNINRDTIYLKDVLLSEQMESMESKLAIGLGKDISGNPMVADLSAMPHLLIAGATGSGKSVCINTIISCLLLRTTPDEVRMVLIDPKRIELAGYEGIPHLIQNVVTDNEDVLTVLNWGVNEMERRYELFQNHKVRNLKGYNEKIKAMKANGEELVDDELPYIIIIVDELADLMMSVGRDVERPITRLAQMARAIGVHLILATQRPSIKVITGIIKANFPSRIAFQVSTKIDSRVIIDANGAEKLLGKGDSLFLPPGKGITERIHCAFISDSEIHNLVSYLKTQPKPERDITIISDETMPFEDFDYDDELFPEAAVAIVSAGTASVSMLQRHFKIGYARAGRLIDMLEQAGIIGPHVGSKPREVFATEEDLKNYGYPQYEI